MNNENDFGDEFGQRVDIRECIWRSRLTQAETARLLGCTRQQLNDWCTGKTYPKKNWERILKRFFLDRGVTIAYKK
jgi:DNA-binding XRE family transcriptional regulator